MFKIGLLILITVTLAVQGGKKKHECDDRDFPCWTKQSNTQLLGLTQVPFYSVSSCLRYCISLPYCHVVDFDVEQDPPCWIQPKNFKLDLKKLKYHKSTKNYLLDRGCLQPRLVPYNLELCWSQKDHFVYSGLKSVPEKKTLGACLNHCSTDSKCNIVNFDSSSDSPCQAQTNDESLNLDNFEEHGTSSNFVLNRDCLKFFNGSSQINPNLCWVKKESTQYEGLEKVEEGSLVECLSNCLLNDCKIVNWEDGSTPKCWIQKAPGAVDKSKFASKASVTTFHIDPECF